jgi:hypothetical protein
LVEEMNLVKPAHAAPCLRRIMSLDHVVPPLNVHLTTLLKSVLVVKTGYYNGIGRKRINTVPVIRKAEIHNRVPVIAAVCSFIHCAKLGYNIANLVL